MAAGPPKNLKSEIFLHAAANLLAAIDTAKIELAPRLLFCSVPSKSIKVLSIFKRIICNFLSATV